MARDITSIKEGDQVKLIAGDVAMKVNKILINTCSNTPGAILCELWDDEKETFVIRDFKPEELQVNERPNIAY